MITIIRQAQSEGRDVRVLHAGDLLAPSLESQIWFGGQMVEALNFIDAIAPTYFVAGNHEFDFSDNPRRDQLRHLVRAVRDSTFDWLGDNYELKTGDGIADAALQSAFTITHGDKTIGVFAITLHPQDGGTARSYVEYDRDYVGTAERVIRQFEAQDVDAIIGLTHLAMAIDERVAALRAAHPKLLFLAGGHEHERQHRPPTSTSSAVFKGSSNARVIWRIDVDFDARGAAVIHEKALEMDTGVAEDDSYNAFSDAWRRRLVEMMPIVEATVGYAGDDFDVTEEHIRNHESGWANFVIDQARDAFGSPPADFAFVNSGSLRIDDYIMGDISYEDIARTFGFSSYLRRLELSGAEMKTLMEAGYVGEGQGNFPQVSGFRVCVDRRLPEGARIVSLQVPGDAGWQEITPRRQYSLVMPDFLYQNNDGYVVPDSLKKPESRIGAELKYLVLDAVIRAQQQGHKVGQAVDPSRPRFVALGPDRPSCWGNP